MTEWDSSYKSDTELTEIMLYHMFCYLDMKLTFRGYEKLRSTALVYSQVCSLVRLYRSNSSA